MLVGKMERLVIHGPRLSFAMGGVDVAIDELEDDEATELEEDDPTDELLEREEKLLEFDGANDNEEIEEK